MTRAQDNPETLEKLYVVRFGGENASKSRTNTWNALCKNWFPKWVDESDCVLELAPGGGEFINGVKARKKFAVDLNPKCQELMDADVEFHLQSADDLSFLKEMKVDLVFSSNFFEHLSDSNQLLKVIEESFRILKPGGLLITLMPNFNAVGTKFFDFLDHTLPLTPISLNEALLISGFQIDLSIGKFIPYSATKVKFAIPEWVVRTYLKLPIFWKLFGGQMFVVARKPV
ncbi:MAG: class I SAM-dependent methyltransferase [Actinobacteria bacterium]|nr:class I SAM-dependent methyltransferase [Actinomycetota bacterium]